MTTTGAWILLASVAVVVLALLIVVFALVRFRHLCSHVGSFICTTRTGPTAAWQTGVARYGADDLSWWRGKSLAFQPSRRWLRSSLWVVEHEVFDLPGRAGLYLVRCDYDGEALELVMSAPAYAGFASWLESAPPQQHGVVI